MGQFPTNSRQKTRYRVEIHPLFVYVNKARTNQIRGTRLGATPTPARAAPPDVDTHTWFLLFRYPIFAPLFLIYAQPSFLVQWSALIAGLKISELHEAAALRGGGAGLPTRPRTPRLNVTYNSD